MSNENRKSSSIAVSIAKIVWITEVTIILCYFLAKKNGQATVFTTKGKKGCKSCPNSIKKYATTLSELQRKTMFN